MNCIVEKKRAEEVVDHQPKTVRLPFGVNLTTDPRFERLTGERMVIICESGNVQSSEPQEKPQKEDDSEEDNEQDTIMIQPVMIPIPQTAFQTHMPQQMPPQEQPQIEIRPFNPMEQMRPPMPPMRPPMEEFRGPLESMRPGMRPFVPRPPVERIIAIRQSYEPVSQSLEPQRSEEIEQGRPQMMFIPQQIRVESQQPQQAQQQDVSPNPIIHHIIQQIIAQKIMESQKASQEQQQQQENKVEPIEQPRPFPVRPMLGLPEEVLTQLNRLPNSDRVIVAVSEPDTSEDDDDEDSTEESQERGGSEQSVTQPEISHRQDYLRRLPVNIPVNMMQQQPQQQDEPQAQASEETRPHCNLNSYPEILIIFIELYLLQMFNQDP
ncbi:hypothetical protein ABEB36_014379 [Hypothenemus hampei]|uniref:Uncharacterized protein n=1 Tax=Hypothenemus hampei TaxID=57062 RepID=A0ABD1E4G3_HYPHA